MQDKNGAKDRAALSDGEAAWLEILEKLPADKLAAAVEMLDCFGGLGLSEDTKNKICNRGQSRGYLLDAYGGDELTDDDYILLEKIGMGTVMPVRDAADGGVETEYSFTRGGRLYDTKQVSAIINRLHLKFALLDFHVDVKNTSRGLECRNTYPVLNRKGRAALKERNK